MDDFLAGLLFDGDGMGFLGGLLDDLGELVVVVVDGMDLSGFLLVDLVALEGIDVCF